MTNEDFKYRQAILTNNETVVKELYHHFREVCCAHLIKAFGCTIAEAKNIYPEAFTIFYYNIKAEKIKGDSLKYYLFGIAKNLFRKRYFDAYHKRIQLTDEFPEHTIQMETEQYFKQQEDAIIIQQLMKQLDEKCRRLIELIFIKEYSHDATATAMNFSGENAVRKKKFDCLKKLRANYKQSQKPIWK